jgi:hypothetical protein
VGGIERAHTATRSQAVVFAVLMNNRVPHRETLLQALYGERNDPPTGKTLDALICQLRRKLGVHGIKIVTLWGQGFEIPEASKARARELMAECRQTQTQLASPWALGRTWDCRKLS